MHQPYIVRLGLQDHYREESAESMSASSNKHQYVIEKKTITLTLLVCNALARCCTPLSVMLVSNRSS